MKRAYLAALTITLLTATSVYALDCATPPTCAELGYTDTVANCSGDSIKCPFDTSVGKCLSAGAVVGQIAYFAKDPGEGWLLCDGKFYHKDKYPDLYAKIGVMFGGKDPVFAVPSYVLGYGFLRPSYDTSATVNVGCAPDIQGTIVAVTQDHAPSGAFTKTSTANSSIRGGGDSDTWRWTMSFKASSYNSFYSSYCNSPSPNYYQVATYIYAGKPTTSTSTAASQISGCAKGYYYYTDGTCSSSYDSSKTMKGIVTSVTNSSYHSYVNYIYGGNNTASSYIVAVNKCRDRAYGSIPSPYDIKTLPTTISGSATAAVSTSRKYWYMDGYISVCSSQTSCTSSTDVTPGTSYYYYCSAQDYFTK